MATGDVAELKVLISAELGQLRAIMQQGRSEVSGASQEMAHALRGLQSESAASMRGLQDEVRGGVAGVTGIMRTLYGSIGGLFAGLGIREALSEITSGTQAFAFDVEELARRLGVTTEEASAWIAAERLAGVESGAMDRVLQGLLRTIDTNSAALTRNQVAFKDAAGAVLPLDQVLLNAVTRYNQLSAGAQQGLFAVEVFHRGLAGMTEVQRLAENLAAGKQAVEDLGLSLTGDGVVSARAFESEIALGRLALLGAAEAASAGLKPAIADLVADVVRLAKEGKLREWGEEAGVALRNLVNAIGQLTAWLTTHEHAVGLVVQAYIAYRAALVGVAAATASVAAYTVVSEGLAIVARLAQAATAGLYGTVSSVEALTWALGGLGAAEAVVTGGLSILLGILTGGAALWLTHKAGADLFRSALSQLATQAQQTSDRLRDIYVRAADAAVEAARVHGTSSQEYVDALERQTAAHAKLDAALRAQVDVAKTEYERDSAAFALETAKKARDQAWLDAGINAFYALLGIGAREYAADSDAYVAARTRMVAAQKALQDAEDDVKRKKTAAELVGTTGTGSAVPDPTKAAQKAYDELKALEEKDLANFQHNEEKRLEIVQLYTAQIMAIRGLDPKAANEQYKLLAATTEQAETQRTALITAGSQATLRARTAEIDAEMDLVKEQAKHDEIDRTDELTQLQTLLAEKYTLRQAELERELVLQAGGAERLAALRAALAQVTPGSAEEAQVILDLNVRNPDAFQKVLQQLRDLGPEAAKAAAALEREIDPVGHHMEQQAQEIRGAFDAVFGSLDSGFKGVVQGILQGTQTVSEAMRKLESDVASQGISMAASFLLKVLEMQALRVAAEVTGNAAILASDKLTATDRIALAVGDQVLELTGLKATQAAKDALRFPELAKDAALYNAKAAAAVAGEAREVAATTAGEHTKTAVTTAGETLRSRVAQQGVLGALASYVLEELGFVKKETTKTVVKATSDQLQVASTQVAATEKGAIEAAETEKSLLRSAIDAAGKAYSALAGVYIIGPILGAAAAAATFAAVLALGAGIAAEGGATSVGTAGTIGAGAGPQATTLATPVADMIRGLDDGSPAAPSLAAAGAIMEVGPQAGVHTLPIGAMVVPAALTGPVRALARGAAGSTQRGLAAGAGVAALLHPGEIVVAPGPAAILRAIASGATGGATRAGMAGALRGAPSYAAAGGLTEVGGPGTVRDAGGRLAALGTPGSRARAVAAPGPLGTSPRTALAPDVPITGADATDEASALALGIVQRQPPAAAGESPVSGRRPAGAGESRPGTPGARELALATTPGATDTAGPAALAAAGGLTEVEAAGAPAGTTAPTPRPAATLVIPAAQEAVRAPDSVTGAGSPVTARRQAAPALVVPAAAIPGAGGGQRGLAAGAPDEGLAAPTSTTLATPVGRGVPGYAAAAGLTDAGGSDALPGGRLPERPGLSPNLAQAPVTGGRPGSRQGGDHAGEMAARQDAGISPIISLDAGSTAAQAGAAIAATAGIDDVGAAGVPEGTAAPTSSTLATPVADTRQPAASGIVVPAALARRAIGSRRDVVNRAREGTPGGAPDSGATTTAPGGAAIAAAAGTTDVGEAGAPRRAVTTTPATTLAAPVADADRQPAPGLVVPVAPAHGATGGARQGGADTAGAAIAAAAGMTEVEEAGAPAGTAAPTRTTLAVPVADTIRQWAASGMVVPALAAPGAVRAVGPRPLITTLAPGQMVVPAALAPLVHVLATGATGGSRPAAIATVPGAATAAPPAPGGPGLVAAASPAPRQAAAGGLTATGAGVPALVHPGEVIVDTTPAEVLRQAATGATGGATRRGMVGLVTGAGVGTEPPPEAVLVGDGRSGGGSLRAPAGPQVSAFSGAAAITGEMMMLSAAGGLTSAPGSMTASTAGAARVSAAGGLTTAAAGALPAQRRDAPASTSGEAPTVDGTIGPAAQYEKTTTPAVSAAGGLTAAAGPMTGGMVSAAEGLTTAAIVRGGGPGSGTAPVTGGPTGADLGAAGGGTTPGGSAALGGGGHPGRDAATVEHKGAVKHEVEHKASGLTPPNMSVTGFAGGGGGSKVQPVSVVSAPAVVGTTVRGGTVTANITTPVQTTPAGNEPLPVTDQGGVKQVLVQNIPLRVAFTATQVMASVATSIAPFGIGVVIGAGFGMINAARGGADVPADMLAQLHGGELVLPADLSTGFRDLVRHPDARPAVVRIEESPATTVARAAAAARAREDGSAGGDKYYVQVDYRTHSVPEEEAFLERHSRFMGKLLARELRLTQGGTRRA